MTNLNSWNNLSQWIYNFFSIKSKNPSSPFNSTSLFPPFSLSLFSPHLSLNYNQITPKFPTNCQLLIVLQHTIFLLFLLATLVILLCTSLNSLERKKQSNTDIKKWFLWSVFVFFGGVEAFGNLGFVLEIKKVSGILNFGLLNDSCMDSWILMVFWSFWNFDFFTNMAFFFFFFFL